MFFWNSKRVDEKLARMDARLAESFDRVKQDNQAVYQWLNYFYEESNKQKSLIHHQSRLIEDLQGQFEKVPKTKEEIKAIVDAYYDHEALLDRMRQITEKIGHLEEIRHKAAAAPSREAAFIAPVQKPFSALREKMIKKIVRNSKDYVKSMVLSLIRKYGRISAIALREIVVDEQALCSKSSFYRILDEIEKEEGITAISSGREKVYVSELPKHARK